MECKLHNVRSGENSFVRIQWNDERLTHIEGNDTKTYDNRVERGSRYYFQLNGLRAEWGFVDVDTSTVIYKYTLGLKDGEIQFFFKDYANLNNREPQLLSEGKCEASP